MGCHHTDLQIPQQDHPRRLLWSFYLKLSCRTWLCPPRRKQGKQQLSTVERNCLSICVGISSFLNLPRMIYKINNFLIVWRKQEDLPIKTHVWVLKLISMASCKMRWSLEFHSQRICVLKGQHLFSESLQVCQVMFQLLTFPPLFFRAFLLLLSSITLYQPHREYFEVFGLPQLCKIP